MIACGGDASCEKVVDNYARVSGIPVQGPLR
jgi:hypothetical protein